MTFQDRPPNFRDKTTKKLFLVRCFNCSRSEVGRENYAPSVATGQCAWCGWKDGDERFKVNMGD